MTLFSTQIAGIAIGVFFVLSLIMFALYYSIDRLRKQNGTAKATTPSSPTGSGSPTPPPQHLMDNQRRTSNQYSPPQQEHSRPSLEYGPGPTWVATPEPETYRFNTIRAVPATPKTSSANAMRPVTSESDKRSSLHQAVLGAGTSRGRKNNSDATKEADETARAKDLDDDHVAGSSIGRQKTYTGAWP